MALSISYSNNDHTQCHLDADLGEYHKRSARRFKGFFLLSTCDLRALPQLLREECADLSTELLKAVAMRVPHTLSPPEAPDPLLRTAADMRTYVDHWLASFDSAVGSGARALFEAFAQEKFRMSRKSMGGRMGGVATAARRKPRVCSPTPVRAILPSQALV